VSNPDLGDEVAENSLDALANFNKDMRTLAVNAYQMQELMNLAMDENELVLQWMTHLEENTLNLEEELVKMDKGITKVIENI